MENNYGNLPSDEKAQGIQIKEEIRKESSSPDNIKAVSWSCKLLEKQDINSHFILRNLSRQSPKILK